MTDYKILRNELNSEEGRKYPKNITLTTLIELVGDEQQLFPRLYIPEYRVDKDFLFEILEKLGYSFECQSNYNNYLAQTCYKIELSR